MNGKYTFLLPAYKACFFEQTLLSIKNQSYTDFKCLVSDDCSPENLKIIFDNAVGDDSRFIYRRNEHNMGGKSLVSHWNLLVDLCETDYLIMASDDDVYYPRFLEELVRLSEKYPNVNLFRGRVEMIDANGRRVDVDSPVQEYETQFDYLHYVATTNRIQCIANFMCRRTTLLANGGYPDFQTGTASDVAFMMQMCVNGVANSVDVLFSFRSSGINLTSIRSPLIDKKKYSDCKLFTVFLNHYFLEYTFNDSYKSHCWTRVRYAFLEGRAKAMLKFLPSVSFKDLLSEYYFMRNNELLLGKTSLLRFFLAWIKRE